MKIEPFGVEQWMNKWENHCLHNLGETCVHSLTIAELLQIAGATQAMPSDLAALKMTYGAITGSERLRTAVAALFDDQSPENVMITHGTIGANALIYKTLVSAGDHVVSIVPTYQQHTAIPRSIGAEVTELPLTAENGFVPDMAALAAAVRPDTKLIAFTNPNNPSGALIDKAGLEAIAAIAQSADAWVLCDEVYRGTAQTGDGMSPSIADLYAKGISTGSTSKAFSLAGLRLGWIVAPPSLLAEVEIHRDYDTISVGVVDDYFACLALENADTILARSRRITRENLAILDAWIATQPRLSYVRPAAGTTALLRYDMDVPSYALCEALLRDTGVMFTPGSVMGMEGHIRVGFANETGALRAGLDLFGAWLASDACLAIPRQAS